MKLLDLIKQFGQANYNYGLFNGADKLQKQFDEERTKYFKEIVSQIETPVKPACEFTQEHFSIVGRAVEKWIKQDLVVEGRDTIGKKEGAKTLRERINEELSKSV